MIILNFTHPLTEEQLDQIRALVEHPIEDVRTIRVQIDHVQGLEAQVRALVGAAGLTPEQWQNTPLLINPPGSAPAAVVLLAELYGRTGYFPASLRLVPVEGSAVVRYTVSEVLDLAAVRGRATWQ